MKLLWVRHLRPIIFSFLLIPPHSSCHQLTRLAVNATQSSDLKIHTVHIADVCLALTLASSWIRQLGGRSKADAEAGVDLPFSGVDRAKLKDVPGSCPSEVTPKAPLFHVVDDGQTTQDKIAVSRTHVTTGKKGVRRSRGTHRNSDERAQVAVAKYFGIKHDYYGAVTGEYHASPAKGKRETDYLKPASPLREARVQGRRLQRHGGRRQRDAHRGMGRDASDAQARD